MNNSTLAYRPRAAANILGVGLTTLYGLIGAGELEARKIGASTVVTAESLARFLASRPKVDIGTGQNRKRHQQVDQQTAATGVSEDLVPKS
jgi:excisionase family DNA binding protein